MNIIEKSNNAVNMIYREYDLSMIYRGKDDNVVYICKEEHIGRKFFISVTEYGSRIEHYVTINRVDINNRYVRIDYITEEVYVNNTNRYEYSVCIPHDKVTEVRRRDYIEQ